ncbi:hypothetical protein MKW94_021108 [Papaver nudicaule]|uniref:Uncharacterized protein n=1 Tax=Papaver nudicaule TaxID=74823 RepID=A0AA41VDJ7_PAPNU|nr:hypothetical protein [Papaver nudicaule]
MKDQKNNTVNGVASSSAAPSSSTATRTNRANNPQGPQPAQVRAGAIRKDTNANGLQQILQNNLLLQRRIKEYIVFSRLKSMIPPRPSEEQIPARHEEATEVDMELREIPAAEKDSDEENEDIKSDDEDEDEDDLGNISIDFDSDYEKDADEVESFVPSIKIDQMDNLVLINTTVLKNVALTSSLFRIFEQENLDIVFENQYRTEAKVAHTIQVRIRPEYNIRILEARLQMWAGLL